MAQQRLRRHLSSDELSRCVGMLEGGCTQTHVANVLGVSQSVVSRAWTRYHAVVTAVIRHAGGRQRATTPREDRFLVVQACRNRFGSAQTLRSDLLNATGTNVCIQTIRNRLHDVNLRARRPCIRVPLTQEHRRRRLTWAQNHVNWTVADWTPCCSVMSPGFVWTTLMVVLECGAGQEIGTRMPASSSMTVMAEGH